MIHETMKEQYDEMTPDERAEEQTRLLIEGKRLKKKKRDFVKSHNNLQKELESRIDYLLDLAKQD